MVTLTQTIKFNLGGHINHSIYWENLAPIGQGGGEFPEESSPLTVQVKQQFGSYENLIEEFTKKTVPIQGSGWGWLAYDNATKSLRLVDLPNQEMLAPQGLTPLLSKIYLIQPSTCGNTPTTSTTRMWDPSTWSKFGRSWTGRMLKRGLLMLWPSMRRNDPGPLICFTPLFPPVRSCYGWRLSHHKLSLIIWQLANMNEFADHWSFHKSLRI